MNKVVSLLLVVGGLALLVELRPQAKKMLCAEDGVTGIREVDRLCDLCLLPEQHEIFRRP